MFMTRQRRLHVTWLLCLAVLLGALMPTLSRALASPNNASAVLAQLCSAGGAARYGIAPADQAPGKQMVVMDDCPYCRVQADLPLLPPMAVASAIPLAPQRPALFYRAPAPLYSWVVAHPRGPPLA